MKKAYSIVGIIILLLLMTIIMGCSSIKSTTGNGTSGKRIYSSTDLFTDRDLQQNVDTSKATSYTVSDGNDITITSAGVYKITGLAENVTIYVEAGNEDKVQIVLDGLSITNETMPCIYVKTASKVFVTSNGDNTLEVTGTFATDEGTKLNGVIFSKEDIALNGTGTLNIYSTQNGITGKDDVKITGGTYNINSEAVGVRANDSIRIANGNLILNCGTDGLHAENDSDDTKGYIYIGGGNLNIKATDDCVHGQSVVQIDDGSLVLSGAEGIEGTYVQINGGTISIDATGDGINAGSKSNSYSVTIEITGGTITIVMASGDTDGIDSNGDIIVSGGTIDVTGSSTFDYDGTATYTGGTIIINGVETNSIPNQMMGGNMKGGNMKQNGMGQGKR